MSSYNLNRFLTKHYHKRTGVQKATDSVLHQSKFLKRKIKWADSIWI